MQNGQPRLLQGWPKFLFRLPTHLYRAGLGALLPARFLYLSHRGRMSGETRDAVLEVASYDRETDTYYVASGWGKGSNWYQNLRADPQAAVQVGRRRFECEARLLDDVASGQMMMDYATRHPRLARRLMAVIGLDTDGTPEGFRALGESHIPFVAFHPDPIR